MASSLTIPRRLPLLVETNGILLPGASMRIAVSNQKNKNMVKSCLMTRTTLSSLIIGVIPQDPDKIDDYKSLHQIGTAAVVVQVTGTNWPKPSFTILVTGLCRFRLEHILQDSPYLVAIVTQLDKLPNDEIDNDEINPELSSLSENLREQASKLIEMLDVSSPMVIHLKKMLESLPSHHLADICASIVKASYTEKLQVLDAVDLMDRLKKALPLLIRQIEGMKLLQKSIKKNVEVIDNSMPARERFKRLPVLKYDDSESDEMSNLEKKISEANLPKQAMSAAMKELKRLKNMSPFMPDYASTRNYLELLVELPWSRSSVDKLDITQARKDLDDDHYSMTHLKKRVLEYLAVRQIKKSLKGPILCFVGPPGIGKTSVGRSIARTMGREFHRISLGGCHDHSDIRGHRRTYIASMPGRIIQGLKIVGVNNPVLLLDEIDKLGRHGLQGDPASALLEVLDPEQNSTFTDHYLNVPFDLSQVLFIATANTITTIPPALLDRMEIIELSGYTQEEKLQIAIKHLMPKQLKEHGLTEEVLQIPDDSLTLLISHYTHEAGVRSLERKIAAICRAVAVRIAEDLKTTTTGKVDKDLSNISDPPELPIVIDVHAVEDILGPPKYDKEVAERLSQPGVAIGLAWTVLGGDIMFVEATRMDGEGKLTLTGHLGDVMKESARLALNWVRSHALECGIPVTKGSDLIENKDIHIHFPAGAVGKDGPSAGVTIVTVLISLFTQRCVRSDTAMTGEITLRGLVLPVGGIKDKVLAAYRAGLKRVIIPKRNIKDLVEISDNIKADMEIILASTIEEYLQQAFDGGFQGLEIHTEPITSSKL